MSENVATVRIEAAKSAENPLGFIIINESDFNAEVHTPFVEKPKSKAELKAEADASEAAEVEAWGHPTFRAGKKMFAGFGKTDDDSPTLGMKMSFDRQEELFHALNSMKPSLPRRRGRFRRREPRRTDFADVRTSSKPKSLWRCIEWGHKPPDFRCRS